MLLVAWAGVLASLHHVVWALALGAAGLVLVISAVISFAEAWTRRPSDLVVSDAGVAISGGPHHGLHLDWTALASLHVQRSEGHAALTLPQGTAHLTLAASDDRAEGRSLSDLADALRAEAQRAQASPPELPADVVRCSACGAALPPSAHEHTSCGACGTSSATPQRVRERVEAVQQLDEARVKTSALVRDVLAQPSARAANVRLMASVLVSSTIVLAFVGGQVFLTTIGIVEVFTLGTAAIASALLMAVIRAMLAARFNDRHSLRSLLALLGASPPRRKGEPWSCRGCGGPLPAEHTQLAVCVYCGQQSVVGACVRGQAHDLEGEAQRLAEVLDERRTRRARDRWRFALLAPVAALVSTVAVFFILLGLESITEGERCERGVARACVSLAFTYRSEDNLGRDLARAGSFAERGCRLGAIDGCCILREALTDAWGPLANEGEARAMLEQKAAEVEAECW